MKILPSCQALTCRGMVHGPQTTSSQTCSSSSSGTRVGPEALWMQPTKPGGKGRLALLAVFNSACGVHWLNQPQQHPTCNAIAHLPVKGEQEHIMAPSCGCVLLLLPAVLHSSYNSTTPPPHTHTISSHSHLEVLVAGPVNLPAPAIHAEAVYATTAAAAVQWNQLQVSHTA